MTRPIQRRTWARVCAIFLSGSVLLAGCGDDDDSASTTSSTSDPGTTESSVPVTDETEADDEGPDEEPVAELGVSASDLAAALTCPDTREYPEVPGVLLVPGTGLGSEDIWALTLGDTLPGEGYDTCWVDLHETATGDIQVSAEYVVGALRSMVDDGYDEIAVVGFSQGVLAARWALTWWPAARQPVVDLIGIAGPSGGAASTAQLCTGMPCAAALQQMTAGSDFLTALDSAWSGSDLPVTLIASSTDTVVQVEEVDAVAGAEVIVLQDICPGREVDHVELVADGVVVAIVVDALASDGPASVDNLPDDVCERGVIASDAWDAQAVNDGAFGAILAATPVEEEPPLADYAA